MERPAKKSRLQGPDGFQKSKSASHYKPPESITRFVSAFDSSPTKSTAQPKPVSLPHHELPQNPFLDTHSEAGPSKPSASKRQSKPLSFAHLPRAAKADKPLPSLKLLKPPVPLGPTTKPESPKKNALTLKSIPKPPPVPILSTKPSVPLKPLAPPPSLPVRRPASPTKPMKTILTTSVALATDPTKEGSGAELLSLFLQQHGHNFVSATDRELSRGVMVSPDKRSRNKDPKYLRGGLAERFHHRISCTKTDFVLWKRQLEHKIEAGTRFGSDMQLRILRVLDVVKVSERARFTPGPRSGLALCRLTRRHALAGDLTLGTYVVIFHFAPTQGERSPVSSIDRFEAGNEAMVWMPWQKVELVGVDESAGLLDMFRTLDTLTPPHSLLVVSRFYIRCSMVLDDDDAMSQGADNDDRELEVYAKAVAEFKVTWQKQKREKQRRFLKAAQTELDQHADRRKSELEKIIQDMEGTYQDFLLNYAALEDKKRQVLVKIIDAQKTLVALSVRKHQETVEHVHNREQGRVEGLKEIKQTCQDFEEMVDAFMKV